MANFTFDGGELFSDIASMQTRFKAAIGLYADTASKKLENYAKVNKPWTNRTHDARNRLTGSWEWQGDNVKMALSHGVEYGIYLEKGTSPHVITGNPWLYWEGASHPVKKVNHPGSQPYPIIMPTIEAVGPQIMQGLSFLFRG